MLYLVELRYVFREEELTTELSGGPFYILYILLSIQRYCDTCTFSITILYSRTSGISFSYTIHHQLYLEILQPVPL